MKPEYDSILSELKTIYIHEKSLSSFIAKRLFKIAPQDKIKLVSSKPLKEKEGDLSADEFNESKKNLYICPHSGHFFKRCPGIRPQLTCCNYFVLNLGLQCNMNCSYCYLQNFINTPTMTIYSNIEQALNELKNKADKNRSLRIGTGETIDSLSLDPNYFVFKTSY